MTDIHNLQKRIHKTALEHGWWEPQEIRGIPALELPDVDIPVFVQRTFGDLISLVHTELSEVALTLSCIRKRKGFIASDLTGPCITALCLLLEIILMVN